MIYLSVYPSGQLYPSPTAKPRGTAVGVSTSELAKGDPAEGTVAVGRATRREEGESHSHLPHPHGERGLDQKAPLVQVLLLLLSVWAIQARCHRQQEGEVM